MDGILSINPGLVIWTIVSFVILILLLKKTAWGPIVAGLDKREAAIKSAVLAADQAKIDAERVIAENKTLLAQAAADATATREKATLDAEARANAIFQEAQAKADAQIERARREIALEEERAIAAVRKEAVDLSIQAASRLLGRSVNTDDNRRLVEQFLTDVAKKEIS
ncbi:MAG: F0F1 ATP synthase subunit B [bacterium]